MKKLLHRTFWVLVIATIPFMGSAQLSTPNINTTILNKNLDSVVNTNLWDDPLRDWAARIINDGTNSVDNIIGSDQPSSIGSFWNAKNRVINIINTITNYALGLLALTALIYLLYHGILMVTAAGDEERYNKWLNGIKYASIALAGIGLSWLIISLIFYIIDFIIS